MRLLFLIFWIREEKYGKEDGNVDDNGKAFN
jgi:hypothetical protein